MESPDSCIPYIRFPTLHQRSNWLHFSLTFLKVTTHQNGSPLNPISKDPTPQTPTLKVKMFNPSAQPQLGLIRGENFNGIEIMTSVGTQAFSFPCKRDLRAVNIWICWLNFLSLSCIGDSECASPGSGCNHGALEAAGRGWNSAPSLTTEGHRGAAQLHCRGEGVQGPAFLLSKVIKIHYHSNPPQPFTLA